MNLSLSLFVSSQIFKKSFSNFYFNLTHLWLQGLIKKYPTIYFFKHEGAWGWEWGMCDLGPPHACMNYCLRSDCSVPSNQPKPVVCVVHITLTMTKS